MDTQKRVLFAAACTLVTIVTVLFLQFANSVQSFSKEKIMSTMDNVISFSYLDDLRQESCLGFFSRLILGLKVFFFILASALHLL